MFALLRGPIRFGPRMPLDELSFSTDYAYTALMKFYTAANNVSLDQLATYLFWNEVYQRPRIE